MESSTKGGIAMIDRNILPYIGFDDDDDDDEIYIID